MRSHTDANYTLFINNFLGNNSFPGNFTRWILVYGLSESQASSRGQKLNLSLNLLQEEANSPGGDWKIGN